MLSSIARHMRRLMATVSRKHFFGFYTVLDNPVEVPVQVAAYKLARDKYVLPGDSVLDVGFGLGYGMRIMAAKAREISGVEIDAKAVVTCQRTMRQLPRIRELKHYDGQVLPYADSTFDVVTCIDVVEHVPNYVSFIEEMLRVSRRVILLSTPNRRPEYTRPDGQPKNCWHLREWSPDELEGILNQLCATWEWNFINGPWEGPFTYSCVPMLDTMALTPALFVDSFK